MSVTNASLDHPFTYVDIMSRVTQFSGIAGVIPSTLVCKALHNTMQDPSIWFTLFDTETIPRIEGHDVATAKEDFQFMYPRTHGAKQMAPLGRFVGIVPQIDPVVFEIFRTIKDPYDPTKNMSDTWVFVVEPESIYRDDVDEVLLKALKTEGDFDANAEIDDLEKQGVLIPYSLKNLKVCADHPVIDKVSLRYLLVNRKVFGYFEPEALKLCSTISKAARVTLMRIEVPESTRNKTWPQQKDELAKNEHAPVKLCTRVFYNATNILNKGTCPDIREENRWTYSRTSDEFKSGDLLAIGGFAPGTSVEVYRNGGSARDDYGTVPVLPAEARSSAPGT